MSMIDMAGHVRPPPSRLLPVVLCFAGLGSQFYRMAAELYQEHPVFRQWMELGDEVVRSRQGFSLITELYHDRHDQTKSFDRLEAAHPALFLVQYALAKVLLHHGVRPDALFGISLGEIVAMTVAGMGSFEPVLNAVSDQPMIYRRTCPEGGMTAVLGPVTLCHAISERSQHCDVAGINADQHFILSGPVAGLATVEQELATRDVPFLRLPVPFAFHSRWIAPAATAFRNPFPAATRAPRWPCWSSCLAAPIEPGMPDLSWRVVREPMQVLATVRAVEARGGAIYVDMSPSSTIVTVLRQVIAPGSSSRAVPILSPVGRCMKGLAQALKVLLP